MPGLFVNNFTFFQALCDGGEALNSMLEDPIEPNTNGNLESAPMVFRSFLCSLQS
jgi:hypothetical protein